MQSLLVDLYAPVLGISAALAGVLLLALIERLRRTFATRDELALLRAKLHTLDDLYGELRRTTEEAHGLAVRLQAEQQHLWSRMNEQVIHPLSRISGKFEELATQQTAQAATLTHIEQWLERTQSRRRATDTVPYRRDS